VVYFIPLLRIGLKNCGVRLKLLTPCYAERALIHATNFSARTADQLAKCVLFRSAVLTAQRQTRWWEYVPAQILNSGMGRQLVLWAENRRLENEILWEVIPCTLLSIAALAPLPYMYNFLDLYPRMMLRGLYAFSIFTAHGMWTLMLRKAHIRNFERQVEQSGSARIAAYKIRQARNQETALDRFTKVANSVLIVAVIAGSVHMIRQMYLIWRKENSDLQGSLNPSTPEEVAVRDAEKTVWRLHDIFTSKSDGRDPNSVKEKVMRNLVKIKKLMPNDEEYTDGIFLKSNVLMVPYHLCLPIDKSLAMYPTIKFEITKAPLSEKGGPVYTVTINTADGYRIPGHDLMLFPAPFGGSYADLLPLFNDNISYSGAYISCHRDCYGVPTYGVGTATPDSITADLAGEQFTYPCYTTTHCKTWAGGDCMTTLVKNGNSPRIIGFHLMGFRHTVMKQATGYAVAVTQEMISDAIALLEKKPGIIAFQASGDIPTYVNGESIGFSSEINPRSPVNWLSTHSNLRIYGSCKGAAHYTTSVRTSILVKHLEPVLGPQKWKGPDFKLPGGGGEWIPWSNALMQYAQPCNISDLALLGLAQKDYLSDLLDVVPLHNGQGLVRKLTDQEILSGINGVRFIDAMNLKTSVGFPLGGPKLGHVRILPPTETCLRPLEFKNSIFMREAHEAEQIYLSGKLNHFIFKACLKDEPVKIEKTKVRVFQCAPMTCQILVRKYFLSLARVVSMSPLISECAVGINAFSPEWEEMHNHITKFCGHVKDTSGKDNLTRIFAGDYGAWDQRLAPAVVLMAFDVLIQLAEKSGNYSSDDLCIMRGLSADIAYPLVNYNGTLVQFLGSNPSGQNLTAYINSIANSLLVRMFYFSQGNTKPFRSQVAVMTYGDDIEGSVADNVINFTIRGYSHWLFENTGMVFTMPDKESQLRDYLTKDESDFLKRKSFYNPDIKCTIGILALSSIQKSYYTARCDKHEEKNILISCITSATYEYFFHGRQTYEYFVNILKQGCQSAGLVVPALLWTYDNHVERWRRQYEPNYRGDGMVYPHIDAWLSPPPLEQFEMSIHSGAAVGTPWVKGARRQKKQRSKAHK